MSQTIGWRTVGSCVVVIVVCLLAWTTLSPGGLEQSRHWRTTNYVLFAANETHTTHINPNTPQSLPSPSSDEPASLNLELLPLSPVTSPVSPPVHEEEAAKTVRKQDPLELHSESDDVRIEDTEAPSFYLPTFSTLMMAEAEICSQCSTDDNCRAMCQRHGQYLHSLNTSSERDSAHAKLFVIPVDALARLKQQEGKEGKYHDTLKAFVTSLKKQYHYLTFKGSDHVFICMSEGCSDFGADLAEALSGGMGTRAIFAGVNVSRDTMKWPCPLRVIKLDSGEGDAAAVMKLILLRAGRMIKLKNRWVCANKDHPANHWEGMLSGKGLTGIYMFEYGFEVCAIPKSGSTMTKVLLRRMMHYENWNQTGTGINQSPQRSGLVFSSRLTKKQKKVTKRINFIKAAIVRHPITRLLSGYLDKIYQKHQYHRVPGLKRCMKGRKMPPKFNEFVHCLIKKHPKPEHIDQHFRAQSAFCNLRHTVPDFLGKQDSLLEEIKEFGESLAFWDKYGAKGWGPAGEHAFGEHSYQTRTHDSGNRLWDYYTEDLMKKVYHYYKEDFDRFGFSIDEMLATNPNRLKNVSSPSPSPVTKKQAYKE